MQIGFAIKIDAVRSKRKNQTPNFEGCKKMLLKFLDLNNQISKPLKCVWAKQIIPAACACFLMYDYW